MQGSPTAPGCSSHHVGGAILAELGRRRSSEVRDGDLVARLGGDEVVVVSDGSHDASTARECAVRLESALAAPIAAPDGCTPTVHASIGIALVDGTSAEEPLRRADCAMYTAKHGNTRVSVYTSEAAPCAS